MTVQQQQQLVDAVMRRVALRKGSSTRRDFLVACLMLDLLIENGILPVSEASGSARSEAP